MRDAIPMRVCGRCNMRTADPRDIEQGYCARCKDWTPEAPAWRRWRVGDCRTCGHVGMLRDGFCGTCD